MIRLFFLALLALLAAPAAAQQRGIDPVLVAEGPAPPGGEVELAIHMRTRPGWHGYWANPGDAGLPMRVDWDLPPGFAAGPLRYPVPGRLTIAGLMNYVFEGDHAILVRLRVPADARGTIPIRASLAWLACTDTICVPEQGSVALDLPVGTGPGTGGGRFDGWRRALPRPLSSEANFEADGDRIRLAIPLPRSVALDDPYFFPSGDRTIVHAEPQRFARSGDRLIATLPAGSDRPQRLEGVLALGDGRGLSIAAVPGPVAEPGQAGGGLVAALLGALAGGFLLNLMPCVFPILALKALHLARTGGGAGAARRDSLAYAAGAVAGTGGLGLALLALRAGGEAAGWAFQLQDPRTILFLFLLATAITLNLLGLFRLPALGGSMRPTGGFGTGALAAFVATPCAGPFLGAALGTALLLPPVQSVLVFAALGLGLAVPFLLLGFVPALRRRIPAPGPWMARLQRLLAIPMAATALAALWLLHRLGGGPALLAGLAAAAVLAILLVLAGLWQARGHRVGRALLVAILAVPVAAVLLLPEGVRARPERVDGAREWSPQAVRAHSAQGRPAFVYFTADWCLTCKANEAVAIDREPVRKAFERAGVAVFAADWTDGDPRITRFLEDRGRAGVPLYLWIEPGRPAEELPQVLTPAMLIARADRPR